MLSNKNFRLLRIFNKIHSESRYELLKITKKTLNYQMRGNKTENTSKCGKESSLLLKENLLSVMAEEGQPFSRKITIVGAGHVGMAIAFNCLLRNLCNELCLIDTGYDKLKGQMMDLQHGVCFLNNARIIGGTDFAQSAGSKLCIITAGSRIVDIRAQKKVFDRNVNIMKEIVPQLIKYSPDTILLVVSKPVDVLTYVALRLSQLPPNRVIGTGCHLDSVRFRSLIGRKLGVAPASCHGWIIGENGKSSVAVWSGINIGGVCLSDLNPAIGSKADRERWSDVHKQILRASLEVVKLKGYSSWAIALSAADIVKAIMTNENNIKSICVEACGYYDIEQDICLSLPCLINSNGATAVVQQLLNDNELERLHKSANVICEMQQNIYI